MEHTLVDRHAHVPPFSSVAFRTLFSGYIAASRLHQRPRRVCFARLAFSAWSKECTLMGGWLMTITLTLPAARAVMQRQKGGRVSEIAALSAQGPWWK